MPTREDRKIIQTIFHPREYALIESLAELEHVKASQWVRDAARLRLGLTTYEAWGASSAANDMARATRDADPYGSFTLTAYAPPAADTMFVGVQWMRNGNGGKTEVLTRQQLVTGGFGPFDAFSQGEPAFLYLQSAGYWRIMAIAGGLTGHAVLELKRVGFSYADVTRATALAHA